MIINLKSLKKEDFIKCVLNKIDFAKQIANYFAKQMFVYDI